MVPGTEVRMTKSEVRNYIKNKRNNLTVSLRNEYSNKIHDRLCASDNFKECNLLFAYVSFGSEVNTLAIIDKAFQMNKNVYIPKVEDNDMNFYEINSFEGLIRSKFGILEPDSEKHQKFVSSLSSNSKKLMLLPGLAFDKSGNRIGYGAGYYDRYLGRHSNKEWIKIALAYDFQIMKELTVDKYDIPADYIITPDMLINCKE
jgi:5-formyltetrahydrofolate cyclo-ligase